MSVPVTATDTGVGSTIVTDSCPVHPLASVTVTVYGDPAAKSPVSVAPIPPVLHKYVYGAVPPLTEAVAEAKSPGQLGDPGVTFTARTAGSSIV